VKAINRHAGATTPAFCLESSRLPHPLPVPATPLCSVTEKWKNAD
jgi:hypothetical protein